MTRPASTDGLERIREILANPGAEPLSGTVSSEELDDLRLELGKTIEQQSERIKSLESGLMDLRRELEALRSENTTHRAGLVARISKRLTDRG